MLASMLGRRNGGRQNKSSYSSSLIKISSPGIICEPSARLTTATLRPGMTAKTLYSSLGWLFLAPMERLWIRTGEFVQYQAPSNSNILCHSCASEFHRTRQRRQTRSASFCGSPSALRGVNRALEQGIKERSASPFASQCEQGMVKLVEGAAF
jgi:hypothetical protein